MDLYIDVYYKDKDQPFNGLFSNKSFNYNNTSVKRFDKLTNKNRCDPEGSLYILCSRSCGLGWNRNGYCLKGSREDERRRDVRRDDSIRTRPSPIRYRDGIEALSAEKPIGYTGGGGSTGILDGPVPAL